VFEWQRVEACTGYWWTTITIEGTTYSKGYTGSGNTVSYGGGVDGCWNYCEAQLGADDDCLKIFVSSSGGKEFLLLTSKEEQNYGVLGRTERSYASQSRANESRQKKTTVPWIMGPQV